MRKAYLVVFLMALLLRAGWGTFRLVRADDPCALEFPDEQQYWLLAESLRDGQGLSDEFGFRATRMPLYPAALALAASFSNGVILAKIAHWLLGAVVAVLVVAVATTIFDRRVGVAAGLWAAIDPFQVFFSSLLLTETLFLVVLTALWWAVWPIARDHGGGAGVRRWFVVGLISAGCVHVRESGAGLVALVLGFVVICRRFERHAVFGALLASSIVAASLVPWAARNARVTGSWCWLTHRGGISLYDGVGPQADGSSNLADVQQMPAVRGLDEVAWNRYFFRESIRVMWSDPWRVLRLGAVKLRRTWNPLPNVETYQSGWIRALAGAWSLPTFAFALAGVVLLPRIGARGGWRAVVFLLLPAMYVSVLHSLFVGSVRYRLVAMPMIEILAAAGLLALFDRWKRPAR